MKTTYNGLRSRSLKGVASRIANVEHEADAKKTVGIVVLVTSLLVGALAKIRGGSSDPTDIMEKVEAAFSNSRIDLDKKVNPDDDVQIKRALEAVKEDPELGKAAEYIEKHHEIDISKALKAMRSDMAIPNIKDAKEWVESNKKMDVRIPDLNETLGDNKPIFDMFQDMGINNYRDFSNIKFDPHKTVDMLQFVSDHYEDFPIITDWIGTSHSDLIQDWTSRESIERDIDKFKGKAGLVADWDKRGAITGLDEDMVEEARHDVRNMNIVLGSLYAAITNPERFNQHINE